MVILPVNQEEMSITVKTKNGTSHWHIRLEKPKGDDDYGSGLYLRATPIIKGKPDLRAVVIRDVRYAKTTDIQKLTDSWVKEYFVNNHRQKIKTSIKYYI